MNKRGKLNESDNGTVNAAESDGDNAVEDESSVDYTEDSFDKFLSNEESDLLK